MKSIPAFALLAIGLMIGIVGFVLALRPIANLYRDAMEDPLADTAEGEEVRDDMLVGVIVGACGVPPLVIGTVLLKRSKRRRR